MHVLATAGHVDHGKSTLVRALTGMEPDRWAEERRRGMTIDLGYAWTRVAGPDGRPEALAFVDVPGHERFIGNTLAGLGPAPGVLFVVAADEGWRRQSEEHLAAVDALALRHGVLAVTRCDLADPRPALDQARERIRRSSLGEIEAVAVSAVRRTGLEQLRAALGRLVGRLPAPDVRAPVRLWVDRAFSVRGSGTVVTGTLGAGIVRRGDVLTLGGRAVTVRGLQTLNEPRDEVRAVARVALNLRGVAVTEVRRGSVLLGSGRWHHTRVADVRVDTDDALPVAATLHLGTGAYPGRVRPLGGRAARLTFPVPLPLLAGDRGVLRDPGRNTVATGFLVLDADPPALDRRGAARLRASALANADGTPDPSAELSRRGAIRREQTERLGVRLGAAAPTPEARAVAGWWVAPATWEAWVTGAPAAIAEWAASSPLEPRMPLGALARALGLPDRELLAPVLDAAGVPCADGRAGAAPVDLGPAEAAVCAFEQRWAANPFLAPERSELAAAHLGRRELAAAERAGRLLRITGDLVLPPDAPDRALNVLSRLPQPFTVSEARQALAATRRVAVPLLEFLDRAGGTERVDTQTRRVRAPGARTRLAGPSRT